MPDNMLPEKHFPLQDLELERTDLYTLGGDKSKPLLLFGLRGPGGMNCLWPVIEIFKREHYPVDLLIDSAAKRILKSQDSGFSEQQPESPLKRIMEIKPAVAVTEFSAGGGTALALEWSQQSYKVPTVCVEDFPGTSSGNPEYLRINPTYLCVQNETARRVAIKHRPSMNPDNIIVTDHPDFDKYASINPEEVKERTRKLIGVNNDEFLVVYSGQLPPETPDILEHLVDSLNEVKTDKKLVLLFSRHPRDTSNEETYQNILKRFNGKIVNQGRITSDNIGFASDLLVTMTSTEGLKSAYRKVPSIHVMPKELIGKVDPDFVPLPVQAEASLGVYSYPELTKAVEISINDQDFRDRQIENMKRHFTSDGNAAQRVAELIKRAANEAL